MITDAPKVATHQADNSSRRQERFAWTIIWAAFALFVIIALAIPAGILRYRESALSPRDATLDVIRGTVLILPDGSTREVAASTNLRLGEGDRIRTASDSQALVTLFDGSTIRLWPDAAVRLRRLRSSAYTTNMVDVDVLQYAGHSRVEVALPTTVERRFAFTTPQASALLREGSYRIEVDDSRTELSVRSGSASVSAHERVVEVLRGEQTSVLAGESPLRPTAALRNLVVNGDFADGFAGWQRGGRNEEDGITGQSTLVRDDGRLVARLKREGSHKHGEIFLHQVLNRDVTDYESLRLFLEVKLLNQSLSGGGWLGSEYPLLVKVRYRDAYGSETTFIRGFYFRNEEDRPTTNGTRVLPNQWIPISVDLFDATTVFPRPAQILWIELEASGWVYDSMVTNVKLQAD